VVLAAAAATLDLGVEAHGLLVAAGLVSLVAALCEHGLLRVEGAEALLTGCETLVAVDTLE